MRSLLLVLVVLFFAASCASHRYNKALEGLHGASIDQAVAMLGQPTQKDDGVYVWSKERLEKGGGYYETTYDVVHRQGTHGQQITEHRPRKSWVAPYENRLWCRTTIYFSGAGTITGHFVEGNDCP